MRHKRLYGMGRGVARANAKASSLRRERRRYQGRGYSVFVPANEFGMSMPKIWVAPRESPSRPYKTKGFFICVEELAQMTASPVAIRTAPVRQYAPSFEDVTRLFEQGDLVPVYRTLPA